MLGCDKIVVIDRLRFPLCILLAVLWLQACASPAFVSKNERSGSAPQANGTDQAGAFTLADTICHQYGRIAQMTGAANNKMAFICAER
jgi:hypothetical protein